MGSYHSVNGWISEVLLCHARLQDKIAIVDRQGFLERRSFFMTYYVGVDIAKYEHVATIIDSKTGELLVDSLHFDNNLKGFKLLLSKLSKLNKDDILIGFESTAHYHQALFNYLTKNHFKCYLINPLMISRFRSVSLRDAKNDNIDSRAISNFLLLEHSRLINDEFSLNELKELCLQRHFLLENSTKLKIKLKSYLDRTFPELCSIIPDGTLYTQGVLALLSECSSAKEISKTRIDHLVNVAKSASKGRYKESLVIKIKEASKVSIGIDSLAFKIKIKQTIESLNSYKRQIDEVNKLITNHALVNNSPLHQIKGINSIEIGYIMSAIISITRFTSPEKLVAYAGLDPKVRQSGTWQASKTRMSKRGNRLLRYALIWTANNIRKHPSKMKEYYELKRSQNKSHYNALGHCAVKLIRYIYWILNNPDKQFVN